MAKVRLGMVIVATLWNGASDSFHKDRLCGRRWGPHTYYDRSWINEVIDGLLGWLALASDAEDQAAEEILDALPEEFKEENVPTGPSRKGAWTSLE